MPRTLLLADDSVTIQKVVGLSFANEDVTLVTVSNGDDALSRAREVRPDLVLADVVMPGRNGYEVCEAIKGDPALRHIPVLLLTGTFEAFDQERARRAGADGHVTKPFEAQALVQQVKDLMERPVASPDPTFEAPPAATDTDPFFDTPLASFDTPLASETFEAEPLELDAEAAAGELELATVAEEESAHDLFGVEAAPPREAPEPSADVFERSQETFRGTPLFAPELAPLPPLAEPSVPEPAFAAPETPIAAPSFALTDSDALSPRAAVPAPAVVLPEDDDFDLGFDEEPFALGDTPPSAAPPADPGAFGDDDPTGDTVLDPGHAPGYDLTFEDLDDPLAATRGRISPGVEAGQGSTGAARVTPQDPAPTSPRPEGSTATFVAGAPIGSGNAGAAASGVPMDLSPALRERLHDTLEKIAWEAFADLSDTIVRQAIERVEAIAWEVIPQLAEQLVREEIRRMKGE